MAQHADHSATHHEESDVNIRAIFGFGAGLIAIAIVIHLAIYGLFAFFTSRETTAGADTRRMAPTADRLPPEPRLQTTPREDLREMRRQEEQRLTTYGWVDRNAGVVHIPIDDAMRLTLERGLPARPKVEK